MASVAAALVCFVPGLSPSADTLHISGGGGGAGGNSNFNGGGGGGGASVGGGGGGGGGSGFSQRGGDGGNGDGTGGGNSAAGAAGGDGKGGGGGSGTGGEKSGGGGGGGAALDGYQGGGGGGGGGPNNRSGTAGGAGGGGGGSGGSAGGGGSSAWSVQASASGGGKGATSGIAGATAGNGGNSNVRYGGAGGDAQYAADSFTSGSNFYLPKVMVMAGDGGGSSTGGRGGNATLAIGGKIDVDSVTMISGNQGANSGAAGGGAILTAGTLAADVINLTKKHGALFVNVATLDVTGQDTVLNLDGTLAGNFSNANVGFKAIDIASGRTLIVNRTNSADYAFQTLNAFKNGAGYAGSDLVVSGGRRVNFHVAPEVDNTQSMLEMRGVTANLAGGDINITGYAGKKKYTLIDAQSPGYITGYDSAFYLAGGAAIQTDDNPSLGSFLYGVLDKTPDKLTADIDLVWDRTGTGQAHGAFNVLDPAYGFTVYTVLADKTDPAARFSGWDGKALTKTGAGTLYLVNNNTYSGGTTVTGGLINFDVTANLGTNPGGAPDITLDGGGLQWRAGGSATDISGRLKPLGPGGGIFDTNGNNVTLATAITGNGGLTKWGAGTLTLSAANIYKGNTTISAGTFKVTGTLDSDGNSTNGYLYTGTIANAGALIFEQGVEQTLQGVISGVGSLTKNGNKKLILSGNNTYTGGTTVNGGILQIGAGSTTGSVAGNIAINNSANVTFNRSNALSYGGVISGTGSLTKIGEGILTLTGVNTYSGGTTINQGLINFGVTENLGTGDNITLNGGGLQWRTGTTTDISNRLKPLGTYGGIFHTNNNNVTLADVIDGSGGLTKTGAGILTLTGVNTYSGGTTVTGGLINFGVNDSAVIENLGAPSVTPDITLNGGGLQWRTGTTIDISGRLKPLGTGGGIFHTNGNDVTLATAITGGGLTKQGTGILTLSAANTYTGNTAISAGGGTLLVTGTLGNGSYTGAIANAGALIFDQGVNQTLSGAITGVGSLTKNGTGTLTLTGGNTYSGGTTVSAGVLQIGNGGTTGSITGNITNNSNVTFNRSGNLTYSYVISGTGSLTKTGTGILTLTGANTYDGGTTVTGGLINFGVDENLGTGDITLDGGGLQWRTGTTTDISTRLNPLGASGGRFDTNGNNVTLADVIDGNGGLTKQGAGTLTLTGANTYSGGTTVSAGVLQIGAGGTTGSIAGNITNNADVTFNRSNAIAYGGDMSGSGGLTQQGTGALTLSGANTYTGDTTVSAGGTLQVTGTLGGGDYVGAIDNDGAIVFNQSAAQTLSGDISGTGSLTKQGTGILTLSGANTYTGDTTISAGGGTLLVTGTLGAGGDYAGAIANAGALVFNQDAAQTLSGVISGAGTLTKQGDGTLTLTETNTYSGATIVNAGTLAGNIAANTDLTVDSGATYDGSGAARSIDVLTGGGTIANVTALTVQSGSFAGVINGNASLTKTGTGTLTLSGNNTYSGATMVSGGTLIGAIANNTDLTVASGATYMGTGASRTLKSLNGEGTVTGTGTISIRSGDFSGNFDNTGTVNKIDTGTLILSGNNSSFNGNITVSAGTLSVGSDNNLGKGTNTLAGGTLDLTTANETYAKAWTVAANSKINADVDATLSGALTGSGGIEKTGDGKLTLAGANTYSGDTTVSEGMLEVTGTLGVNNIYNGNIANDDTLVFDQSADQTLSGVISGTGGLTKEGTGTLTLSENNTYTGDTTVSDGTLNLTGTGALASNVKVEDEATLALSGTIGGNLDVDSGGTLDAYAGGAISGNLTATSATIGLHLPATATPGDALLTVTGAANVTNSTINITSAAALANDTYTLLSSTYSSSLNPSGNNSYSVYGHAVTESGGVYGVVIGSGRVRGGFVVALANNDEDLTLTTNGHVAPNTTDITPLTWKGTASAVWVNYDASAPNNWDGTVKFNGVDDTPVDQYLDGDAVLFDDYASKFTVNIAAAGVAPDDVTVNNTVHDYTFTGGAIASTGSLTKDGTGKLILANANAYADGTIVDKGILQIGNSGTTGSIAGNIELKNNANVIFNRSNDYTYNDAISGTGSLTQAGDGKLTLTNTNNNYSGETKISAGTLSIGSDDNIGTGTNTLAGGTLDLNAATTYAKDWTVTTDSAINANIDATLSGVLSGSGDIEKTGTGKLTLSGNNNSYTGDMTVSAGTLSIGSDDNIGTGTNTLAGGTLDLNTAGTYAKNWTVAAADSAINVGGGIDATLLGDITGGGGLTKTGDGILILSGTNDYDRGTTVSEGKLVGNIAAGTNLFVDSDATYDGSGEERSIGTLTGAGNVISDNTLTVQSGDFSGVITGDGGLTKTGPGMLFLWNANNTYEGATTVFEGILVGGIAEETDLHVDLGAAYMGTGKERTINKLTGEGSVMGGGSLSIRSGNFSGDIGGTGSVIKIGDGTLILSGTSNAYGDTIVSGGTLSIGSDGNIGSGTNTLAGGTLDLNTAGTYEKAWTVSADSEINAGVDATLAGALTGAGGIEKTGSRTLTLTGNNTYTGGTTVSGGSLQIGGGGETGSIAGDIEIKNDANVIFKRSNDYTYGGAISGTGSLNQAEDGKLTLTGTNTYTGATTVSAGTLSIGSDANIGSGANTLAGGALDLNAAGTYAKAWTVTMNSAINADVDATLSGVLSGSGGIEKTGSGKLTLTGTNTYSGGTKISAGTLSIGSDANLGTGSGTNTLAGGTLDLNAAATYAKNWTVEADSAINAGVDATISGVLSGPGGIEKTGSGKLTLTGTNAYGGATKVSAGTLVGNIAADTDLAVYSGATYDSGGAARSIDALTGAGNVIIDNTLTVQKGDFDGVITGTGGLTKIGTGTLSLWNANNDYTGATTVSEGMLIGGIAEGTDLHVAFGATYKGTGAERTIGELTGAGTVSGAGSLSINRGSFSGTFGDTGTVIKIGAETLILSGNNNSFEGNITVSAGTLSIRSDDNIGMGTNTLAGGTLDLAEAGTYAKAWTVSADSVINADVDATLEGALDGEGGIEKTGSGTLTLTGDNTYAGVTKVSEGILQIGDGGETGSIAGNIVNNANVTFNRSDDLAYGHAISGSGGLTKRGSGTLALSGANTYSGMTTVEAGKLQLASGGAISNQLTLRGGAEFDSGGASVPLARLDVYGGAKPAIYTGNLVAGEVMNFYVPATMASGGTLLAVDGTVLLANPTVNVGVDGAATPLQAGDHIVLVESNASLGGTRANSVARGTGMQGVTLDLAFDLAQTETQLLATLSAPPTVNPDAKNLSEGYLAGPALLSQGTDFLLSRGRDAMRDAASAWRPEIFATAGGWKIRHRTGSSVDVRGRTLVAGLAAGGESGVGRLAGAIFLEYGSGDYDSHNSHAGYRIKGSGDTSHLGAGLLAELAIPGGFNLDASLRAGSVKTDYRSDDLRDQSGVRAEYGAKSAYLGAHLGVGKAFDLSAAIRIEPYLRGIWTRQGRDATQLSTGERLEFDATASKRLRLGLRASRAFTPAITARVDLAVDREFSGEARARTNGHAIEAPRLRGTTGVGEIGLTATPRPGKPFQIDVGIQGYAGRRTGVSGGVTARYFF